MFQKWPPRPPTRVGVQTSVNRDFLGLVSPISPISPLEPNSTTSPISPPRSPIPKLQICHLPRELKDHVFSYVTSLGHLKQCRLVCKEWADITARLLFRKLCFKGTDNWGADTYYHGYPRFRHTKSAQCGKSVELRLLGEMVFDVIPLAGYFHEMEFAPVIYDFGEIHPTSSGSRCAA